MNGETGATAILLIKTKNHDGVRRLLWVRQGETVNLTHVEINFLREALVDMVVVGEVVAQPLKSCNVLWQLSPLRPQSGAKLGEYGAQGDKIFH